MEHGSLFWFGGDVATGYEVPFDEPATILIFKTRPPASGDGLVTYLHSMAAGLEEAHRAGTPFLLSELPQDHPARTFARSVRGD